MTTRWEVEHAAHQLTPDEAPATNTYPCVVCGTTGLYRRQGAVMVCQDCAPGYTRLRQSLTAD